MRLYRRCHQYLHPLSRQQLPQREHLDLAEGQGIAISGVTVCPELCGISAFPACAASLAVGALPYFKLCYKLSVEWMQRACNTYVMASNRLLRCMRL